MLSVPHQCLFRLPQCAYPASLTLNNRRPNAFHSNQSGERSFYPWLFQGDTPPSLAGNSSPGFQNSFQPPITSPLSLDTVYVSFIIFLLSAQSLRMRKHWKSWNTLHRYPANPSSKPCCQPLSWLSGQCKSLSAGHFQRISHHRHP